VSQASLFVDEPKEMITHQIKCGERCLFCSWRGPDNSNLCSH
jgi:hypothetical protein